MLTQIVSHQITAANDAVRARTRTVPIPQTIIPVPGYPSKLVVFKMAASKYWQTRCWIAGTTYKKSTKTQSLRVAQSFARRFYEQLLAQSHGLAGSSVVLNDTSSIVQQRDDRDKPKPQHTFAALAAQMFAAEEARVERGEFTRGSLMVLRNRLDSHLIPRWGNLPITEIGYKQMIDFVDFMSSSMGSTTISQYVVAMRKVFTYAVRIGVLEQLPEFPKVKIKTASRGAFTPTEYWRILRTARSLRGKPHPDSRRALRKSYKLVYSDYCMPPDLAWAVGFMVNSFIRPSDLKTLKHKHVEIVRGKNTYLRLTLPETKKHNAPIVTLFPAVRIYRQIIKYQQPRDKANPNDYLFLPELRDRNYALTVLSLMFNWVLSVTGYKQNAHGQPRSLYSLRHSAITFRLLYGQGIDLLTLARNARTSVEVINNHYASTVSGEQNIALLQSRRSRASFTS
ncbi:MAG: hypothetical protein RLZ63_280 [Pseudomonadota bacterium]|jgi:integrase